MSKLFSPVKLGPYSLHHRVVMAPLTRMRAGEGDVPTTLNSMYYNQRASEGGLIIAEASPISPGARGYVHTPGIWTTEQAKGWKKTIDAVHKKGGIIFLQLWHVGRVSHSSFQTEFDFPDLPVNERRAVSASPIAIEGTGVSSTNEFVSYEIPRALLTEEMPRIAEMYKKSAELAKQAGFDGIEIHGANGYLINQFLSDMNQRTDEYGQTIENKSKLLFMILEEVTKVFPSNCVGIRFSPWTTFMDTQESDAQSIYSYILKKLNSWNLAYIHLIEPRILGGMEIKDHKFTTSVATIFRKDYKGLIIIAGGYTRETAMEIVEKGDADLVAFGRHFISNPDLPFRLQHSYPLNPYNRKTFYVRGPEGYTDYPFYSQSKL